MAELQQLLGNFRATNNGRGEICEAKIWRVGNVTALQNHNEITEWGQLASKQEERLGFCFGEDRLMVLGSGCGRRLQLLCRVSEWDLRWGRMHPGAKENRLSFAASSACDPHYRLVGLYPTIM